MMHLRALFAAGLALGPSALVGCTAGAPAELSHLPRDAQAVWAVDAGALRAWPGFAAPGPLAQLGGATWDHGVSECGLDVSTLVVVGSGTGLDDLVLVLRAPGIGETSVMQCLGRATWRDDASTPWWSVDGDALLDASGSIVGRPTGSDAVVIAARPERHDLDALAAGSDEPFADSMRDALAAVDYGAPLWVAFAAEGEALPEVQSVAADATLRDGIALHARLRTADAESSARVAESIRERLREVAGWVYASPSLVEAAEITPSADGVELGMPLTLAQWQGLDVRFVGERRGLGSPEPEPEPKPESPAPERALAERLAVAEIEPPTPTPEAVAAAVGPTGIPECDEYIEKYRACIETKLPESVKETALKALDTTVDAWKEVAGGPSRDALNQACQTASEAAQAATHAMGCSW